MKILYGVQATGNGHITRARAMQKALSKKPFEVDYLFSGRDQSDLFDMEMFGNFLCYKGMTFVTDAGSVKPFATYQKNSFKTLFKDIKELNLNDYDLVLTDFEPISAWAARRQKKNCIAIGHQYAFDHGIPKKGNNIVTSTFMQYFAPANIRLGLHWHHFNQPILPPIADTHTQSHEIDENKILVYLGFERKEAVIEFLKPFTDYEFYFYCSIKAPEDFGHIHLRPLSREGFQNDLSSCNGVITNAGFELASEAIHLGKKLLVKPLKGQMEQLSNAVALEKLHLGKTMTSLDKDIAKDWLENFKGKQVVYPSVPDALAEWIAQGDFKNTDSLVESLWDQVYSPDIIDFTGRSEAANSQAALGNNS